MNDLLIRVCFDDLVSNSGQQVITLGVMLGVLMIIFHSLAFFRVFQNKRKQSKTTLE